MTQFHIENGHSVTLRQAANTNTFTPPDCTEIFLEICVALRHVYTREYLHNDIKANNVVLKLESGSEKYKPFLIDFSKSTKVAGVVYLSSKQMAKKCPFISWKKLFGPRGFRRKVLQHCK